jgi:hypothetical protein
MNHQALQENDVMNEFTLEEAVALIYRHAVLKKNVTSSGRATSAVYLP